MSTQLTTPPAPRRAALAVIAKVAVLGLCVAAVAVGLAPRARSVEVVAFEGSYPRDVKPTGVVREVELVAAPTELPLLDGRRLAVWAYNNQVPGPTIHVRVGETLRATLVNHLPEASTIHWHGQRLPNAMDGVPGITQPPVEPNGKFVYEFTPRDAGTFWFHPHLSSSEQVERGLFGVLIVDEATPAQQPAYSRDVVWVLDDWRLGGDGQIDPNFVTRHDLMHDGRWGQQVTVNGHSDEKLLVRAGERVRLRLLNVANGRVFVPDFASADLHAQAIAVDGMYAARPFDPKGFELPPGARLDVDLSIPASARGNRFIVNDCFFNDCHRLATIEVTPEEPVAPPAFASPARARIPAWSYQPQRPPTAEYRINARAGGEHGIEWTLNGEAFTHAQHSMKGQHAPANVKTLPVGKYSVLRFTNDSFRLHPMHLHGTFFKLLARNGVAVDEPHWRDTVLVHSKETVDVGLVPLERGSWMMHCHILEHAESGMMTTVDVR